MPTPCEEVSESATKSTSVHRAIAKIRDSNEVRDSAERCDSDKMCDFDTCAIPMKCAIWMKCAISTHVRFGYMCDFEDYHERTQALKQKGLSSVNFSQKLMCKREEQKRVIYYIGYNHVQIILHTVRCFTSQLCIV